MFGFTKRSASGGRLFLAAFVSAAGWCSGSTSVEAQGFLDLLFGAPKPQQALPIPMPQQRQLKPAAAVPVAPQQDQQKRGSNDGGSVDRSSGTYRTVCVRMCDGAFIPMSYATTKSNFQQDQNKCRASCGDNARLFFHRNPGGAMEDAVDMSGRVYGSLPTAFKFRKTLVEGCSCRPPPWSEAELARHRSYAVGPQSPVPGQPLPPAAAPATKIADASKAGEPTSAKIVDDNATATPAVPKAKAANRARDTTSETPRVIKIASQKPSAAPLIIKVPSAQPSGGLFGFGQSGMGLTGQPKYKWPGD